MVNTERIKLPEQGFDARQYVDDLLNPSVGKLYDEKLQQTLKQIRELSSDQILQVKEEVERRLNVQKPNWLLQYFHELLYRNARAELLGASVQSFERSEYREFDMRLLLSEAQYQYIAKLHDENKLGSLNWEEEKALMEKSKVEPFLFAIRVSQHALSLQLKAMREELGDSPSSPADPQDYEHELALLKQVSLDEHMSAITQWVKALSAVNLRDQDAQRRLDEVLDEISNDIATAGKYMTKAGALS